MNMRIAVLNYITNSVFWQISLSKKVSKYGDFSGPYFPLLGLNTDQKKLLTWTFFAQYILQTFCPYSQIKSYLDQCRTFENKV